MFSNVTRNFWAPEDGIPATSVSTPALYVDEEGRLTQRAPIVHTARETNMPMTRAEIPTLKTAGAVIMSRVSLLGEGAEANVFVQNPRVTWRIEGARRQSPAAVEFNRGTPAPGGVCCGNGRGTKWREQQK